MTNCCNPFTGACEGGHGCAAHTEPWPVLDAIEVYPPCRSDCNQGRTCNAIPDESNHLWPEIAFIESAVIWIIVSLCAMLVFYMGFLAYRTI